MNLHGGDWGGGEDGFDFSGSEVRGPSEVWSERFGNKKDK